MFKKHPKGLLAAALANMGERFGFYVMMAILSLFLMSKFGLDETKAGIIYSVFYFAIYMMAFFGGIIADKTKNFKGTILAGLVLMAVGYFVIAIPTPTPVPAEKFNILLGFTCFGLVDQDYSLPESVLKGLGIDVIDIPRTEVPTTNLQRTEVRSQLSSTPLETINISMIKRGIISVNKVGYIQ